MDYVRSYILFQVSLGLSWWGFRTAPHICPPKGRSPRNFTMDIFFYSKNIVPLNFELNDLTYIVSF